MIFKGIIAAAGLSSRMGDFKPLMKLNGFPVIEMTVQSMKNAGICDICVVVGKNADTMRAALEKMDVQTVENRDYAVTDMMTSIRLGLERAGGAEGVFILPGDMPLIAPETFGSLKKRAESAPKDTKALVPVSGAGSMHPPLLLRSGIRAAANYTGAGGLRGALEILRPVTVSVDDGGAALDADFHRDFAVMESYAKRHRGISGALCEELYEICALPEHIRAHCRAVGELAARMAERLIFCGRCLDVELCRSGGYLHDIRRLEKNHGPAGGAYLRSLGYDALAAVVEEHMKLKDPETAELGESVIVFLADKLIKETERIDPIRRYAKAVRAVPAGTSDGERIRADMRACLRLSGEFEKITGEKLF